jgi:hypothetical protein
MQRPAAAAFSALALLAGAGCMEYGTHATRAVEHSTSSPPSTPSGIPGTLRLIGGPWPGHSPLAHARIHVLAGGQVVGLVKTDERGRFILTLPPGTYHVELSGGQRLFPGRVVVAASRTTRLSLKEYAK